MSEAGLAGVFGMVKRLLGASDGGAPSTSAAPTAGDGCGDRGAARTVQSQEQAASASSEEGLSSASSPMSAAAQQQAGECAVRALGSGVDIEEFTAAVYPTFYSEELQEPCDTTLFDRLHAEDVSDEVEERRERKRERRSVRSGPRVRQRRQLHVEVERREIVDVPVAPLGEMVVIGDVLRSIDAYDSKLQKAAGVAELDTHNSGVLDLNAIPSLSPEEQDALVTVFDHMLANFYLVHFRDKYGFSADEDYGPRLSFGQDVPSYFANVVDQSIHRRKVLSMAGMRNLVAEGRRIYEDLAARKFASDPELYCGDVGVNRMRRVTGNTVDLDTCVLRASDRCTMRAINAANEKQGLPTWDCHSEFSSSDQAYQIANAATLALTEQFVKDMKMTDEEARRRKVHASQIEMPVPMATHNTHRGKWPVWHYVNVGIDSFHANVPNMHDVNGALLRAPMHCVKGYLHAHQLAAAHGSEEARAEALQKYLDRFFEDAVADSCFNMKWKAVEEFNEQLAHERTIVHLLQVTQADHQALFSAIMDDDDDDLTRERAEMWRLVEGAEAYSTRDAKVRTVTKPDVDAWVADPSVSL